MSDDDALWYPLPMPVHCSECGEYVGIITGWKQAAHLATDHRQVCEAVSEYDRTQASFDKQFLTIADQLTQEGFPCQ